MAAGVSRWPFQATLGPGCEVEGGDVRRLALGGAAGRALPSAANGGPMARSIVDTDTWSRIVIEEWLTMVNRSNEQMGLEIIPRMISNKGY